MTKPIYIHAGAQRSGSSSFQLCLAHNRALLTQAGFDLAYPGRDGAPKGQLRLKLPAPRHDPATLDAFVARAATHLGRLSPDPARAMILSEENFPGRMLHFLSGRFFPASRTRFETLARALPARPVHLLYVVRDYAGFFESAYRRRAEDTWVKPFANVMPKLMQMDRGLPELIAEMRDVLQPERLTVIDYADRGESRALLARLVPGLEGTQLEEPSRVVNLSPTDAALAELQAAFRRPGPLSPGDKQAILTRHADADRRTGFAQFSEEDRAILQARHQQDLARIAELPGVTYGPCADVPPQASRAS